MPSRKRATSVFSIRYPTPWGILEVKGNDADMVAKWLGTLKRQQKELIKANGGNTLK